MFTTSHIALRTVIGTLGTVIAAGVCLIGATAPAAAAAAPRALTVSYSDLNLSNDAGRNTFDNRVKQAARSVCANGGADLRARAEQARCVEATVAAIKAQTPVASKG